MLSKLLQKNKNLILICIPAIITFFLVFIPTFKYSIPLDSEAFNHVIFSQFYVKNIVLPDSLLYSNKGDYSPLFNFLMFSVSNIFNLSPLETIKFSQPIFAFLMILSFSFTASKMYNEWAGFFTGIFSMFSVFFYKIMMATPEIMILILIPLISYFYYIAVQKEDLKCALISGLLLGMGFLIHAVSTGIILMILTIFTAVLLTTRGQAKFKAYIILISVSLLMVTLWLVSVFIKGGFMLKIPVSNFMLINTHFQFLGALPLLFAFIGGFFLIKRREIKDILILVWICVIAIMSFIHFSLLPLETDYVLSLAIFPLMLMAGIGVQCIRIDNEKNFIYAIAILILILGTYQGFLMANSIQPQISSAQIDVAQWFKNRGDKDVLLISDNSTIYPVVFHLSNQKVPEGPYYLKVSKLVNINKYLQGKYNKTDIINDNVGYMVMNKNVSSMPFSEMVYENSDFRIFELG